MKYLNRHGDLELTMQTPSVCIFNNFSNEIPEFGYIVPTYKRSDLLKYALQSILSQKGMEYVDILVVDDYSQRNDETERMMLSEFNIPGIAYYKNSKNLGQPGNWNKLIGLSRAKWLIMLQDDDMLYPDFFIMMKKCMSLYSDDVKAFFSFVIDHEFTDDTLPERKTRNISARYITEFDFLQGCIIGAGALGMCINRELAVSIGGVNNQSAAAVDYDFYARLAKNCKIVKMYNYPLGVWRTMLNVSQHDSTVRFCIDWGTILKYDTLEDLNAEWFKPVYCKYVSAFNKQHYISWAEMFAKEKSHNAEQLNVSDKLVLFSFRTFFRICRKLRRGKKNIKITR